MKISQIRIGNFIIYRGSVDDRCNLASSQNVSCAHLKELANDPCTMVRIRLAYRNDLPDDIVQILLSDVSSNVRYAILNNEKIKIPEDQLRAMAGDVSEEEFIRKQAQERLNEGIDKEKAFLQFFCFCCSIYETKNNLCIIFLKKLLHLLKSWLGFLLKME